MDHEAGDVSYISEINDLRAVVSNEITNSNSVTGRVIRQM